MQSLLKNQSLKLQNLGRPVKLAIMWAADLALLVPSVFAAYVLRLSNLELPRAEALIFYLLGPIISIVCATLLGVYQTVTRTYTYDAESRIWRSQLLVVPVWAMFLLAFNKVSFARSVMIIYVILAMVLMIALRKFAAYLMRDLPRPPPKSERTPVVIFGAGREGIMLAESLKRQGRYLPMAFVDTDYSIVGRTISGIKAFTIDDMDYVMQRFAPREVMVAKPKQNRASRRAMVDMFMAHGLQVKTIPDHDDLADGKIEVSALQPVKLEDLLGRDPVPPNRDLMEKAVKDRVVLITGAGGSIGSELARQAANFSPKKLILLDHSEFSLFEIHREIESQFSNIKNPAELTAILGNILDQSRVSKILSDHKVDVVLHAAAYKHVRMVQENARDGLLNNIFGTKTVAEAAMAHKVKLFILVSTDKAVRPTSIMGASKRVAEMVIQALASSPKNKTTFAMVRFGNVLGSTGSVIPLFREQINKGGPIQVTHPDVTRFFMLIPEAAQLVIQAGAMGKGGDVFVLDMGESVKIMDLAKTMIELQGLTLRNELNPQGDIEIKITGLRDGEKLYEELQIGTDISKTDHMRIMRSNEFFLPAAKLNSELKKIETALNNDKEQQAIDTVFKLAGLGS
jgi:FlaA1/EpsC-like NDP-sugar epimerase